MFARAPIRGSIGAGEMSCKNLPGAALDGENAPRTGQQAGLGTFFTPRERAIVIIELNYSRQTKYASINERKSFVDRTRRCPPTQ
jgi:hypothetical protein